MLISTTAGIPQAELLSAPQQLDEDGIGDVSSVILRPSGYAHDLSLRRRVRRRVQHHTPRLIHGHPRRLGIYQILGSHAKLIHRGHRDQHLPGCSCVRHSTVAPTTSALVGARMEISAGTALRRLWRRFRLAYVRGGDLRRADVGPKLPHR
jgi:hypothetical protein